MLVPAWVCVPLAMVAYIVIKLSFTGMLAGAGTVFARFAAAVIIIAGIVAALGKAWRRKIYDGQTSIESIRALSWQDFELLIAEAFRRQGYQVTENGGGGADGGIDLILHGAGERVLVQCKRWKVYKVGVDKVRELFGVLTAEGADRAILVTSGVYTGEARNFASGKPLELIDGTQLCRMMPATVNESSAQSLQCETGAQSTEPCPLCGSEMALKTARQGRHAGSQFWGCTMFGKTDARGRGPLLDKLEKTTGRAVGLTDYFHIPMLGAGASHRPYSVRWERMCWTRISAVRRWPSGVQWESFFQ